MSFTVKALLLIIFLILLANIFLIVYDFTKRFLTQIKYKKLDLAREYFRKILSESAKSSFSDLEELKVKLKVLSPLKKQALLEVITDFTEKSPYKILLLAKDLGLIEEYERKLSSSKSYNRGEALKILSSLNAKKSLEKMFETIKKENDPEVAFAGFLSCCKLLDNIHFKTFLTLLYEKQRQGVLNLRSLSLIITDFINRFKEQASFAIYDFLKEQSYSVSFRMTLLDGLYYAKYLDETLLMVAKDHLAFEEPEILAKALKLLSKSERFDKEVSLDDILPFLKHPSWFVRLSTLKVLEKTIKTEIVKYVTPLLEDENALIRKEAARVLFKLPEEAIIERLPNLLEIKDSYGRDAVVEEMVISGI
ncbi:HEAT repeat domain-containing protein, partial [Thermodesulfovibrio sp. N1]|uniref:HEAT repeat domain-containing protein n=1 Tax=Thermodesulfovibrio sp. N1 TaxID=1871110 RepID=UPI0009F2E179